MWLVEIVSAHDWVSCLKESITASHHWHFVPVPSWLVIFSLGFEKDQSVSVSSVIREGNYSLLSPRPVCTQVLPIHKGMVCIFAEWNAIFLYLKGEQGCRQQRFIFGSLVCGLLSLLEKQKDHHGWILPVVHWPSLISLLLNLGRGRTASILRITPDSAQGSLPVGFGETDVLFGIKSELIVSR